MALQPGVLEHARVLHRSAREAKRAEAASRRAAQRYMAELHVWCEQHGIKVEDVKGGTKSDGQGPTAPTRH